jgi:competence ComEA-like helix-hairpin-helix protein
MDNENQSVRTESVAAGAGQLKTAFFAGFVLCICFALPILRSSDRGIFAQIDSKLNPNIASVGELAELPNISLAKAQAMAEYRQNDEKTFENKSDLEKVKGIGEKTVEKTKEWFVFE